MAADVPPTILQLNEFPVTLDPDLYENAKSNTNPNGDLRPLYAFRQLVDPVPTFASTYRPSWSSTETVYEQIIGGANAAPGADFAASVISSSQKAFDNNAFANLDGTVGSWRPIYASPEDWYDVSQPNRFRPLNIDLQATQSAPQSLVPIGDNEDLMLKVGTEGEGEPVASATTVRSIEMNYLLVTLTRPWFNSSLFSSDGWFLGQQSVGFCSSGSIDENSGILPLVPTSILLGMQATVDADWSAKESETLDAARAEGKPVFLGPFLIEGPESAATALQVIGWISELTPLSPRLGKQSSGTVTVRNSGGYIARFSMDWSELGTPVHKATGNFPAGSAKEIDIPATASNIRLKIEIMTFPRPFETWKTVSTPQFDAPVTRSYTLSGTTLNVKLKSDD